MNIFKCSIGTFKIVCEHTESSGISVGTFWNVLEHWKSSRTCSRTSFRTIEIIHDQLSRNVLECSCGTFKNVPEHSKRFRNELAKHFKLLSEICLRCNLNVLHKKYMNILRELLGEVKSNNVELKNVRHVFFWNENVKMRFLQWKCEEMKPPSGLCFAGMLIHFRSGKFQALDICPVFRKVYAEILSE